MNWSFNIDEHGEGSYRLLAILRWVMAVIFMSFGIQKFTLHAAAGVVATVDLRVARDISPTRGMNDG